MHIPGVNWLVSKYVNSLQTILQMPCIMSSNNPKLFLMVGKELISTNKVKNLHFHCRDLRQVSTG